MKDINNLQNRKINKLNRDAGFPIPVNLSMAYLWLHERLAVYRVTMLNLGVHSQLFTRFCSRFFNFRSDVCK